MDIVRLHDAHARHLQALPRSARTIRFDKQATLDIERHMWATGLEPDTGNIARAVLLEVQGVGNGAGPGGRGHRGVHAGVKGLFSCALEEGVIDRNPALKLPVPSTKNDPPTAIQPEEPEEVVRCLAAARRSPQPQRNVAVISLGIRSMRALGRYERQERKAMMPPPLPSCSWGATARPRATLASRNCSTASPKQWASRVAPAFRRGFVV